MTMENTLWTLLLVFGTALFLYGLYCKEPKKSEKMS